MNEHCLRGRILHYAGGQTGNYDSLFTYIHDGVLNVRDGKVTAIGPADQLAREGFDLARCEQLNNQLIMPGFIDLHVHAPQLDVIGSYGEQLLDWLNKYTFPAELRFADPDYSQQQTRRFIDSLFANGTTSAMVFTTTYTHSVEQLFAIATEKNMRIIAGNVLMDRNAPAQLLGDTENLQKECIKLIERWHKKGRIGYALTPRFAGTSTPIQLQAIGELAKTYPDVWLQTHLSENTSEIAWTLKLFSNAKDYLHAYEIFGLAHEKTVFAHCIHLSADERQRLANLGCSIAFCPSSNLFLGSGLFDLAAINSHGIAVGLASDVGGGTSLSQFKTMGDAYKVCQLQNYSLSAREAFYLTTLGAAKALHIDNYVGNLEIGKEADFIVLNHDQHPFLQKRCRRCNTIEEELFTYMTAGDDRLIERTYIAGRLAYQSPQFNSQGTA